MIKTKNKRWHKTKQQPKQTHFTQKWASINLTKGLGKEPSLQGFPKQQQRWGHPDLIRSKDRHNVREGIPLKSQWMAIFN